MPTLEPRPYRPSRNAADRHRASLLRRDPEEWVAAIEALPPEIQAETACTIWWDFFSQRTSAHAWPHLDRIIHQPYQPAPRERHITALMQCGYTRHMAESRTRHSEN